MRVHFTRDYDHTYPSRAMQFFPKGYEGTVKREVGEAAIAAKCAKEVEHKPADHGPDADDETVHDVTVHDVPPTA